MDDLRVVIDAGHGGNDSGAVGNGVKEKDLTLKISQYMYDRFLEAGIPATLTRSTDETVTPTERVRRILAAYGDSPNVIVISNHINSTASEVGPEGAEVIYALRNDDTLAQNILNELGNAGQIKRNIYQRTLPNDPSKDYYFIHRNTGSTEPVIVEYGFINNLNDLNRIQENYKTYVDAVIKAVLETFEVENTQDKITYTVRPGDTLWNIAQRFNTTVDAIKILNNLNSDILRVGQILNIPAELEESATRILPYTVRYGDTLWSIAKRFNTNVEEIKRLNHLTTNMIYAGQTLMIPSGGVYYIVRPGDTLWSIAQKFNTTVNSIKNMNGLNSNMIFVGQILKIM